MAEQTQGAVVINGLQNLQGEDLPLLYEALARVLQHRHMTQCVVWCGARRPDGWLELLLCFQYDDGGTLTVGALQRHRNAVFEFHS